MKGFLLLTLLIGISIGLVQYQYPNIFSFLSFIFNSILKGHGQQDGREERCLEYVRKHAMRNDAIDVIQKIDTFGWNEDFLMNIGDAKGDVLSEALKKKNPTNALEIGAYVGYSATRIGSGLESHAHLTSIEVSPFNAAIARQMVNG